MKRNNPQPQAKPSPPSSRQPHSSDATKTSGAQDQIRRNQSDLGIAEDHRTEDMKKRGRGTFP